MQKKIPYIGIGTCILYFIAVLVFLVMQTEIALTIWEAFTIIGAPIMLFVMIQLANLLEIASMARYAMLVFMAATCSLTGAAHIVNITVTRRLIAEGINVPSYFRIGCWPSVEMAVDYLAWGFFMGLAFLVVGCAVKGEEQQKLKLKRIVIGCGVLCLLGFLGAVLVNENLWYLAPIGYGIGPILICVKMLRMNRTEHND